MKITALLASACALIGCLCAPSLGANSTLRLTDYADYDAYISYMGRYGRVTQSVPVGPLTIKVDGSCIGQKMLCVDLHSTVSNGDRWIAELTSSVPQQTTSAIWDKVVYIAMANNGWSNGTFTEKQSAAVQVAIWELIEDNGTFDLTSGNFRLESNSGSCWDWFHKGDQDADSVANLAKGYFDAANPTVGYASSYKWYNALRGVDCHDGYQDMIYYQKLTTTAVPEVPTALPLSLGLTMLGALKGRFFSKRK